MIQRARPRGMALVLAALALAPAVVAAPVREAAAQASADAGAHFERGVGFFKDGDYVAAMVEFKKAYELDPNYRVLYNLGQCSRELRDYAAALTSFERYLAEGRTEIDPDRRARVEGWVGDLRGKVGKLTIATNVEGADVAVDDVAVGKTPLPAAVVVNAGRRKLTMSKVGYAPLTRVVDVAGTEEKNLAIDMVPLAADTLPPTTAPAPTTPPPEAEDGPSPWPWAVVAVTAATGTATAILGIVALGKKSDFEDALETYPTSATEVEDARGQARTFAIAADVMGGVTIAGAAVAIVGFVIEGQKPGSSAVAPAPLRVHAGPGFTGVSGAF
jgi:hypothetical protein